jgi:hypothetical protein
MLASRDRFLVSGRWVDSSQIRLLASLNEEDTLPFLLKCFDDIWHQLWGKKKREIERKSEPRGRAEVHFHHWKHCNIVCSVLLLSCTFPQLPRVLPISTCTGPTGCRSVREVQIL